MTYLSLSTQLQRRFFRSSFLLTIVLLAACSNKPVKPDAWLPPTPLPASFDDVNDERQNFQQLYCQLNRQLGAQLPDYRSCEDALYTSTGISNAPAEPVDRSSQLPGVDIVMVPGLGWDCIAEYVNHDPSGMKYALSLGYAITVPSIEGISSSHRNAQLIYRHLVNNKLLDNGRGLIFIGYSKGVPDILEALVAFPHIAQQTLAVIGVAGAVAGTPVAEYTADYMLDVYNLVPGKDCVTTDHDALESLKPAVRKQWLADNPLPAAIRYYSLITFPEPENISRVLRSSYKKLSRIDARNDSQLLFYDQVIPGSTLLGFLNADHIAAGLGIKREHEWVGRMGFTRNDYPRELLLESILRYVEADLNNEKSAPTAAGVLPAAPKTVH